MGGLPPHIHLCSRPQCANCCLRCQAARNLTVFPVDKCQFALLCLHCFALKYYLSLALLTVIQTQRFDKL